MVFIKNYLPSSVFEVDSIIQDQVCLRLRDAAGILFGFVCVPPRDSPYFTRRSSSACKRGWWTKERRWNIVFWGTWTQGLAYMSENYRIVLKFLTFAITLTQIFPMMFTLQMTMRTLYRRCALITDCWWWITWKHREVSMSAGWLIVKVVDGFLSSMCVWH